MEQPAEPLTFHQNPSMPPPATSFSAPNLLPRSRFSGYASSELPKTWLVTVDVNDRVGVQKEA
jgi:hypothetical protein